MTKTFKEILSHEDAQVVEQAKAMATAMLLDMNLDDFTPEILREPIANYNLKTSNYYFNLRIGKKVS
jgi:hypothetical protein